MPADDPRAAELLDKYRQGTLTPAEARELDRLTLSDEDVFDAMAMEGMLEQCLADPEFRKEWLDKPLAARKRRVILQWALPFAAALVLGAVLYFGVRPGPPRVATNGQDGAVSSPPVRSRVLPALGKAARNDQPILLAARLTGEPAQRRRFRGGESGGMPRAAGAVLSVGDAGIIVSLSAADGVQENSVLTVLRDGRVVGAVEVVLPLEDRSRTRLLRGGPVQPGDRVSVDAKARLNALWGHMDGLSAGKDFAGARRIADEALAFALSVKAGPQLVSMAEERVAEAEFRAGDVAAARRRYRELLRGGTGATRRSAWEALGVISLMTDDLPEARRALEEAGRLSAAAGDVHAQARALNNLAVLAEMTGDPTRAFELVSSAREILLKSDSPRAADRQAIELNWERLRRSQ